jgi:hypothetical protein
VSRVRSAIDLEDETDDVGTTTLRPQDVRDIRDRAPLTFVTCSDSRYSDQLTFEGAESLDDSSWEIQILEGEESLSLERGELRLGQRALRCVHDYPRYCEITRRGE